MSNDILQQLYDGKIYPAENIGENNPELEKINGIVAKEKEKFIETISGSVLENYLKLDDLQDESAAIYGYECFAHGFKLAASLLIESLGKKEGNNG